MSTSRWWMLAIAVPMIGGYHSASGHAPAPGAQRPSFHGGVEVVAVNVTVTDAAHRYVTDLQPQDFLLFEDGRSQELTLFYKTGLPLALTLLVDTSASMEPHLLLAQEAAVGLVRGLAPEDVASFIDFDSRVQVRQSFTTDRGLLEAAIRQTTVGGSTSLYNAVYIALQQLNKTERDQPGSDPRRRAIVLLSDGEDTSSLVGLEEVLDLAARSDIAVYAIGLFGRETSGRKRPKDGPFVLRRLAQQTGGLAFFPLEAKELPGIYGEIRAELSSQYSLAYESDNPRRDGQFRRIAVRTKRPGLVARTRPGYYAPAR